MDEIHNNYSQLSVSKDVILHLHRMMQGVTATDSAGKYKEEDNLIMAVDVNGRRSVRFKPVDVFIEIQ